MRIVLNSLPHQKESGYKYELLISTHPHQDFYLHFALHGTTGSAREKVVLAGESYEVRALPDGPGFSKADQARFEEWLARNADELVDAYRNARIFEFEQAFE